MKYLSKIALLIVLSFAPLHMANAQSFGIAATVNKDAISERDLNDRMQLVLISSGLQNTKSNQEKVKLQALNSLIEEQLKIQEAKKQNLEVTDEEVKDGLAAIAEQNKMTVEQFSAVMKAQGIPQSTLMHQIKAQIAWSKVISKVLRPQIEVSEKDMNAKMERIKDNIGKIEYQTAEIFLPVNSEAEDIQTKQLAQKLIDEMKAEKVRFSVVAAQFSKAASAEQGGLIGWVQEGELPKELDLVVKSLSKGQVSPPIKSLSGYYIMMLLDKRAVSGDTMPSEDDVLSSIGLERLDRLQQRHLADIRSAAFIDLRS